MGTSSSARPPPTGSRKERDATDTEIADDDDNSSHNKQQKISYPTDHEREIPVFASTHNRVDEILNELWTSVYELEKLISDREKIFKNRDEDAEPNDANNEEHTTQPNLPIMHDPIIFNPEGCFVEAPVSSPMHSSLDSLNKLLTSVKNMEKLIRDIRYESKKCDGA